MRFGTLQSTGWMNSLFQAETTADLKGLAGKYNQRKTRCDSQFLDIFLSFSILLLKKANVHNQCYNKKFSQQGFQSQDAQATKISILFRVDQTTKQYIADWVKLQNLFLSRPSCFLSSYLTLFKATFFFQSRLSSNSPWERENLPSYFFLR